MHEKAIFDTQNWTICVEKAVLQIYQHQITWNAFLDAIWQGGITWARQT